MPVAQVGCILFPIVAAPQKDPPFYSNYCHRSRQDLWCNRIARLKKQEKFFWWKQDLFAEWNRLGKLSEHHADPKTLICCLQSQQTKAFQNKCEKIVIGGILLALLCAWRPSLADTGFQQSFCTMSLALQLCKRVAALGWIARHSYSWLHAYETFGVCERFAREPPLVPFGFVHGFPPFAKPSSSQFLRHLALIELPSIIQTCHL